MTIQSTRPGVLVVGMIFQMHPQEVTCIDNRHWFIILTRKGRENNDHYYELFLEVKHFSLKTLSLFLPEETAVEVLAAVEENGFLKTLMICDPLPPRQNE